MMAKFGERRLIMLGTHYNTMGGISAVVNVYRAAGLFARRHVVYLATHRDGSGMQKLVLMLGAWLRFMWMLASGRVGLLHVHLSSRASFWRKLAFIAPALWVGRPVLLHLHGSEFAVFYEQECTPLRQRVVRWVFSRANRVVVLSAAWADWVRTITSNAGLRVIYNPVLLPSSTNVDQSVREPGRILFLGRMGLRKGTFDLLDAVAQSRSSGAPLTLALGGDGDRQAVLDRVHTLDLEAAIDLLGWVRGADKPLQLERATIFCLPSHHEGLPMGILEAMAAGLPIVSTPVGGIPEAVSDGVEGFLVAPGDVPALAARLAQLAQDPALVAQMGAAARHKVARCFAASVIVPQVEALYDEMLAP